MALFRRKGKLKQSYDAQLLELMNKQKKDWEQARKLDSIAIEEHPESQVQLKIKRAKYFSLFKEARIRNIKGNVLD